MNSTLLKFMFVVILLCIKFNQPPPSSSISSLNCTSKVHKEEKNILYESECTVSNPVDASKEKEADLGKRQGVYVGESSRSIHERALEHDGDYRGQKDDSHMMKHWLTSHADRFQRL